MSVHCQEQQGDPDDSFLKMMEIKKKRMTFQFEPGYGGF